MGQTIGRATLVSEAKKFTNCEYALCFARARALVLTARAMLVPKDAVDQLWESFNDVAEGFGLSIEEFLEITRTALKDYMELSDKKIDQLSAKVFGVFDDDKVICVPYYCRTRQTCADPCTPSTAAERARRCTGVPQCVRAALGHVPRSQVEL
jgi:hypothetical protein